MKWTPDKIQEARTLRAGSLPWRVIGEHFGVSGNAARSAVFSKTEPAKDDPSALKARIEDLERVADTLASKLAAARKPRTPIAPHKPAKTEGSFIRVAVPDLHGCFHDPLAFGAFLHDLKALDPREVVVMGDLLDCGGFLAEHHTWGYVAEADYTYEDDIAAANSLLDSMQAAAPSARFYFLEGNHERRVEQWCLTSVLRSKKGNRRDVKRLVDAMAPEVVLNLADRGIEYFKQGEFYHGLKIRATIRLGDCYFTHGSRCGVGACRSTLADFGGPVVFGHTHHIGEASVNNVKSGSIAAWNIGCLCQLQPLYGHDRKTAWNHGYGVQFVTRSGLFQHVTARIVDGQSMLIPLTQKVA